MEPPPQGYLFSPFIQVRPESARTQALQPATSPPFSMNTKIMYTVLWLDRLSRSSVS